MTRLRTAAIVAGAAALALVTTACSEASLRFGDDKVEGSGRIVSEARDVDNFDRVVLAGEGTVVIVPAASPSLVIETDDNLHTHIESVVRGDTLTISTERNIDIEPTDRVVYRIGIPDLSAVELKGAGTFELPNWEASQLSVLLAGAGDIRIPDLTADDLDVSIPGAGSVTASGRVASQSVTINGAGTYDAADLWSGTARIDSHGIGNATVWVQDHLDLDANGIGNVSYYGNPEIDQNIRGLGSIRSLGPR